MTWRVAYWLLSAAFLVTATLNMLHVRAGFLTNHAADLVVPAFLYVMVRGLAEAKPRPTLLRRWFGTTPERAALTIFTGSVATELSQYYWPSGIFRGWFDPWDIAAFGVGLSACFFCDKLDADQGWRRVGAL